MGEILRAIMERNCIWSQPAIFNLPLSLTTTVAARSFARRQASARWKSTSWFLAIGAAQFTSFDNGVNSQGWATKMEPSTFLLQRASNAENFELNAPAPKSNHNDNLNNFVSLMEYPLFQPGELVTVFEDVVVTDPVAAFLRVTTLALQGVEYHMPPGKGFSDG